MINATKTTDSLYEAEADEFSVVNAVLEVPEEDIVVEEVDLLEVAEQDVTLAVQVDGDQVLHLRVHHIVFVALGKSNHNKDSNSGKIYI